MNTPGLSIFQSGDSIKLDNSINRAEEEEALEALKDQQRRDEELDNDLQNAFDDLIDDEDNTVDSSNFQSDVLGSNVGKHIAFNGNHCMGMAPQIDRQPPSYPSNNNPNIYAEEFQKMKMLLDSKTRELDNISKIAHDEKRKREETEKRLAISEAERERANLSKKSEHELLVESKEKCSNLENLIQKLKLEIKVVSDKNNDLLGKLETSQMLYADVQQKYHMVEKNMHTYNDRNVEMKRKEADQRHQAEVEAMQQKLDNITYKLEKKTTDLDNMKARYDALQSSHDVMLIDKSSKINDLSKQLVEAQKQCQELMCRHDYSQENNRLQRLVSDLQKQIQNMERTIDTLNSRLEQTTADLDAMDTVLQQNCDESFRHLSQTQGRVMESTPISPVGRLNNLKGELFRAMANLRKKREDIRLMQQSLDLKNHEIKNLKDEENKALVEINVCKEENVRLKNKLKLFEEELDELRSKNSTDKVKNLQREIEQLTEERQLLQNKLEDSKQRLLNRQEAENANMASELRALDSKVKNLQIDLEEVKQERDSLKLNYEQLLQENETHKNAQMEVEKLKFLLKDSQNQCDHLKNLYSGISDEKEAISIELKHLRQSDICKELKEQKDKSANLNRALQLAEVKCSELSKILETQRISHEKDLSQLKEELGKKKAESFSAASKNTSNPCTKCIEYVAECTKLEIQSLRLTNQCSTYQKQIDSLNSELSEAKQHISDLSDKLVLIDEREKLIVELKAKAQQFEEYIKTQSSSGASSLKQTSSEDKGIETSPQLESKFNRQQVEAKIRDEMAKIFANEIRNSEQRFKVRMTQREEEIVNLRRDIQKINMDLIQRQNEVQVLKHAILSERDKTEELMKNKDKESNEIFQKQNVIIHKCRDELKLKTQRISELLHELDERNSQIEAERQSMKAVMTQWEEQQRKSDNIKDEWENKIDEMKKLHESAVASWQTKYNSAKKTAANYKRYAEDKENHMIQEYNRIKSEYELSLAKIEIRMKEVLEKKNREMKDAIAEIERKTTEGKRNHSQALADNRISS